MFNIIPKQYKSSPHDLLHFIGMLNLWQVSRFSQEHHELVVAIRTWTGVLQTPRPMATLYIAERMGHRPMTGTIVLIDNTELNAQSGTIELLLEGRPFHSFNPNEMWTPRLDTRYPLQDCAAFAPELREVIAAHWDSNWFSSAVLDQK